MDDFDASSKIRLEERRDADGIDAYVPLILCDGELYYADVDRFFLDLALNGVRSRHSIRAYRYDVTVWLSFLTEVCDKTVYPHLFRREATGLRAFRSSRGTDRQGARLRGVRVATASRHDR